MTGNSYGVFYWGVIKCSKIDSADGHTTLKLLFIFEA